MSTLFVGNGVMRL